MNNKWKNFKVSKNYWRKIKQRKTTSSKRLQNKLGSQDVNGFSSMKINVDLQSYNTDALIKMLLLRPAFKIGETVHPGKPDRFKGRHQRTPHCFNLITETSRHSSYTVFKSIIKCYRKRAEYVKAQASSCY